jgi:hypothetical protein
MTVTDEHGEVNATLKLSDGRLREMLSWLSGITEVKEPVDGPLGLACHVCRKIDEPTPSELASITNELISVRFAVRILLGDHAQDGDHD